MLELKNRKTFLERNYCWFSSSRAVDIVQQKWKFAPIYGVKCPYPLLRTFLIGNKTGNYVIPSENLITKVKTLTGYTTGKEAKEPLVAKPLQELPAAAVILAVRHDNRLRNFPRCTDQSHHCSRAHFYYLFIRGKSEHERFARRNRHYFSHASYP